jgi:hypothetical protein
MNPFQNTYDARLRSWRELRQHTTGLPLLDSLIEINRWWQQAPLVKNHIHPLDSANWPDPWTLLSNNTYCLLTRALGMCYNLIMDDITDFELVIATDVVAEEHYLVLVSDRATKTKYIMNHWPDTVSTNKVSDFTIKQYLNTRQLSTAVLK